MKSLKNMKREKRIQEKKKLPFSMLWKKQEIAHISQNQVNQYRIEEKSKI